MDDVSLARTGAAMHGLARELFPFCRSLTGDGVRRTMDILVREIPGLTVHEVPIRRRSAW